MAFTFGEKKTSGKVKIQAGELRVPKGQDLSDAAGVNITWDTEAGRLDGSIRLINAKTSLSTEADIKKKITDFINDIVNL